MGKKLELTGQRFGRLTVVKPVGKNRRGLYIWLCKCDCGKETRKVASDMKSGNTTSCGCAQHDFSIRPRMKTALDLSGKRFGRLVAIEQTGKKESNTHVWRCECDCGKECEVRVSQLLSGKTRSCGCINREQLVKRNTSHNESKTRLYRTWKGIRGRCNNQNSKDYKHYGGRGIGLCAEWQEFEAFRDWALSNGYSDDLSIDRIDNDKGYSPDNCRWATQTEQTNNKSNNLHIEYRGETKTLAEWCRCLNLKYNIIHSRLNLGWTFGRAITEPVQKPHRKTIAGNPA